MNTTPEYCVTAYISGRVQGVWFRAFTREQALAAGLTGWAKNLPDGRVEARLQGQRKAVEQVLQALHQGPPNAIVNDVQVSETVPEPLSGFSTG